MRFFLRHSTPGIFDNLFEGRHSSGGFSSQIHSTDLAVVVLLADLVVVTAWAVIHLTRPPFKQCLFRTMILVHFLHSLIQKKPATQTEAPLQFF